MIAVFRLWHMSHQTYRSAKTNTRWWSYRNGRLQLVVEIGVRIQTKWLLFFLKPTFLLFKSSFDSCYFVLDLDHSSVFFSQRLSSFFNEMSHIGLIFTNDWPVVGPLVLFWKPKIILGDKMWFPISNFTTIVSSR